MSGSMAGTSGGGGGAGVPRNLSSIQVPRATGEVRVPSRSSIVAGLAADAVGVYRIEVRAPGVVPTGLAVPLVGALALIAGFALAQATDEQIALPTRKPVARVERGAGNGDFELARQKGEFRMEARPLTQEFSCRSGILNLVGSNARELISGHVSDAVS